jgi:hypothetical protein
MVISFSPLYPMVANTYYINQRDPHIILLHFSSGPDRVSAATLRGETSGREVLKSCPPSLGVNGSRSHALSAPVRRFRQGLPLRAQVRDFQSSLAVCARNDAENMGVNDIIPTTATSYSQKHKRRPCSSSRKRTSPRHPRTSTGELTGTDAGVSRWPDADRAPHPPSCTNGKISEAPVHVYKMRREWRPFTVGRQAGV